MNGSRSENEILNGEISLYFFWFLNEEFKIYKVSFELGMLNIKLQNMFLGILSII